ncbi:MAG: ABC transporter permease [Clostridiales bacterium]|nr:ABC transporter permease [Clostridiales bacterium]
MAQDIFVDEDEEEQNNKKNMVSKMLEERVGKDNITRYSDIDLLTYLKKENWSFLSMDHAVMELDGKVYKGKNDYSYDFEFDIQKENATFNMVPFSLGVIDTNYSYFNNTMNLEFSTFFPNEEILLSGNYIQTETELVMSDYVLKKFGITDNYKQYLGKEISFSVDGQMVLEHYVLVGVINENYFRINANASKAQILIPVTTEVLKKFQCVSIEENAFTPSFAENKKLIKEISKLTDDFWYSDCQNQYEYIEKIKLVVEKIFSVLVIFIVLSLFLKVACDIDNNIRENFCYYGVLRAMGLKEFYIYLFIASRLFLLSIACIIFATMFSFAIMQLLNTLMYSLMFIELQISLMPFFEAAVSVLVIVIATFCAITWICSKKMLKAQIIENLK